MFLSFREKYVNEVLYDCCDTEKHVNLNGDVEIISQTADVTELRAHATRATSGCAML